MTAVESLARFVVSLRYEAIPERVLERARYQIVNVLASMLAGADTDAGAIVRRTVRGWNNAGPCTVVPTGERLSLHDALFVNAAYSMALDYDDYVYMGHTGHSAVLASLALAERDGLSARDALVAQVIGNEVGGRLGASTVLGPQNGQAWSFIHALEGAAVGARLLGLDERRTAHALAIALYQPTFTLWPGFMGPQSKVLTAAGPMITGVQAAELAREGMTGALDIIEHPRKGFWAAFTWVPLPELLEGLGDAWVTDTIAYKRYPGCAYIGTTMDALFAARASTHGPTLRPDDVEHVRVEASLVTVEMDNLSSEHLRPDEPLSPINVNFSIALNVGIGLVAGRHTSRELSQQFLDDNDRAIRSLAARTELVHDWPMTLRVADAFGSALGRRSPLARLGPRDLVTLLRGFRSQHGGHKAHSLDVRELVVSHRGEVARLARKLGRARRKRMDSPAASTPPSFEKFRMVFPARVTITTRSGERLVAEREIPAGAPGAPRLFETVEDKLRSEASGRLAPGAAEHLLTLVASFESASVGDVLAAACARV